MAAPVATRRTSHNTVIARRLSLAQQAERKRQHYARENKSLQGSCGLQAHVQSRGGGGGLFPDSNDRSSHKTEPNAARSTSTLSHIDRQLFWREKTPSVKAGEAHHASTLAIIVSGGHRNGRTFNQCTAQWPAPPCRPT
ncbi:unnamed protein product, partial [Ectocarpus sp. 12 AP-2014]